jgi:hypothetical protein
MSDARPASTPLAKGEFEERERKILQHLDRQRCFYDAVSRTNGIIYGSLQVSTIVFAALTPVVLAARWPEWTGAFLGALAAITASINGAFPFREDWKRQAATANALNAEAANYQGRALEEFGSNLSDDERLVWWFVPVPVKPGGLVRDWRFFLARLARAFGGGGGIVPRLGSHRRRIARCRFRAWLEGASSRFLAASPGASRGRGGWLGGQAPRPPMFRPVGMAP